MAERNRPSLSIVLMVRDEKDTPGPVIRALAAQPGIEAAEIILADGRNDPPIGHPDTDILQVKFLRAPGKNMPNLKALGAAAATGTHIAFLEPKAVPGSDWLEAVLHAAADMPGASLGGTVLYASPATPADQAAFIFEYGAFAPARINAGHTHDLPGNNMVLPRQALQDHCADILATEGLNKPFCQQRLAENGHPVQMRADMQVAMTTQHNIRDLLASRFFYARCYGGARILQSPAPQRWLYRLGAPIIPVLLIWRHLRAMPQAEVGKLRFATPFALIALCLSWAAGETAGYWFGKGAACQRLY